MLNAIIKFCLQNRLIILLLAGILSALGVLTANQLSIDVIPDINRPKVTIFTGADGWAPEEIESLITFPIERAVNGSPGILSVRSTSAIGLSIVNVEFDWGMDNYQARQIITEKLQTLSLPKNVKSSLGPSASLLGEVVWGGVTSKDQSV